VTLLCSGGRLRAMSEQRAHLIDRLYADPRAADVLLPAVDASAGVTESVRLFG
jgi:hypothetical protein